jgi:hypothetical protein
MNDRWYSNPTQIYFTCRELALGKTLNHMDVIGETHGWRLGAIVHTLKHEYDWPIRTAFRGPERIGHYRLAEGCDPTTLRLPPSAQRLADELRDRRGDPERQAATND